MPTILENFKLGDFLYGLDVYRDNTKKNLRLKKFSVDTVVTVDSYNNLLITNLGQKTLSNPEEEAAFIKGLTTPQAPEEEPLTKFSFETLHKHYQMLKSPQHPKLSIYNNQFPKNNKELTVSERKIRRACKACLFNPDVTIHFILDGINVLNVFDRTASLEQHAGETYLCKHDSYTSAELRYLLKHYETIKQHVKFYADDNEIDLFSWLSMQSAVSRKAILQWTADKREKNKVTVGVQEKIEQAFQENASSSIALAGSPVKRKILVVPPTPRQNRGKSKAPGLNTFFSPQAQGGSIFKVVDQDDTKKQKIDSAEISSQKMNDAAKICAPSI
jgi:hypothetical protein